MSDETEVIVDPALNAADPAPVDPPQPESIDTPEPAPRMIPADVLVREVTPLRAKNRELEAALEEHRRRDQAHQELIARLQQGGGDTNGQNPPQPRQPDQQFTQQDIERAAHQLNFQRDAAAISDTAGRAYGQQWVNSLNILGTFGLNSPDMVGAVMDIVGREKTHEVMHAIGQDPELAASIAGMSPVRKVAELTKIAERMNTKAAGGTQTQAAPAAAPPPARTVSRAPAPAPRVDAAASAVVDWRSDKASDEDFSRGFEEMMAKRRARR